MYLTTKTVLNFYIEKWRLRAADGLTLNHMHYRCGNCNKRIHRACFCRTMRSYIQANGIYFDSNRHIQSDMLPYIISAKLKCPFCQVSISKFFQSLATLRDSNPYKIENCFVEPVILDVMTYLRINAHHINYGILDADANARYPIVSFSINTNPRACTRQIRDREEDLITDMMDVESTGESRALLFAAWAFHILCFR